MSRIHNYKKVVSLALCMLLFSGCGSGVKIPDSINESSLIVTTDGKITMHIVGTFDKEYYDIDGLKVMAQEEVEDYHAKKNDDPSNVLLTRVEKVTEGSEDVIVTYDFRDKDAYQDFVGKDFFYGTVKDAVAEGYDFGQMNQVLYSMSKENTMVSGDLMNGTYDNRHVILLEDNVKVYAPRKVGYISENAELMEDGSVGTAGVLPGEYPVIIVLDK